MQEDDEAIYISKCANHIRPRISPTHSKSKSPKNLHHFHEKKKNFKIAFSKKYFEMSIYFYFFSPLCTRKK